MKKIPYWTQAALAVSALALAGCQHEYTLEPAKQNAQFVKETVVLAKDSLVAQHAEFKRKYFSEQHEGESLDASNTLVVTETLYSETTMTEVHSEMAATRAAQADARRAQLAGLATDLRTRLRGERHAQVDLWADMVSVTIDGSVSFDSGSDRLEVGAFRSMNAIAQLLNDRPEVQAVVEGHTDATGAEIDNYELSERRAKRGMDYLLAQGVNYEQVNVNWRGERAPIASNRTSMAQQANRRLVLFLTVMPEPGVDE